jgi:hypothetical protein
MGLISHILILAFATLVVLAGIIFLATDMFGRLDYLKENLPWLNRILERKTAIAVLLLVAIFLLVGDAFELVTKEVPDVPSPPTVQVKAPLAPVIQEGSSRVITRTLPVPEPEQRCWLSNHFGMPNSTIKGAVTASAAIIHCNHKVDAPYLVQVEFDRDFIPGAGIPLDSGITITGGQRKRGRIYMEQINSPALLSDQVFVVTVYGETDQYPRALRASV